MAVDAALFKQALAQWASGVSVVTSFDNDSWKGLTVSSFTSVSLDPPLVMICIGNELYTRQLIEQSKVFAVNILSVKQQRLGEIFAGMHPEIENRFAGLGCTTAETGSPIIPDTLGWVDCQVEHVYPAGDHTIFVGKVIAAGTSRSDRPILYFNRSWGQFAPLA